MNITFWSLTAVFLYIGVTAVIGHYAYRRNVQGNITDYFLAGRSVGTFALVGTLFATWFSTFAFIGGPATYYRTGVNWLLFSFFNVFGPMCIWFIGARFWTLGKKFGFITPSDMLGLATPALPEAHRSEYHGFLKALNSPEGVRPSEQTATAD